LCEGTAPRPLCLVTLENSRSLANILCVFEGSGAHSNYGSLEGRGLREFMGKALILLRDRFDLREFENIGAASADGGHRRWRPRLLPLSLRARRRARVMNAPTSPSARVR